MMRKVFSTTILAALLSGCATAPTEEDLAKQAKKAARFEEFQRTIPICEGEEDCKVKWEAAQIWISNNAGYKIQIATDALIETYNAVGSSPYLAAKVTKEPLGGGRYRIFVQLWCDNLLGCMPKPIKAALKFNQYVGAAAH